MNLTIGPCIALLLAAAPVLEAQTNIVFIFTDDWGWGDLGCHGHPYLKTPNLDGLASADFSDVDEGWLDGVTTVGITSAASTPDDLVQEIVAFFRRGNPELEVIEEGEWENITFRQPKRVPPPTLA